MYFFLTCHKLFPVGSGPTCYLAEREKVLGIILHAPFLSGLRVLTPNRVLCCCDVFQNVERITNVQCPVFILHGVADDKVQLQLNVDLSLVCVVVLLQLISMYFMICLPSPLYL